MNAWNENTGATDHSALMSDVASMDLDSLHYVAADCRAAVAAMPEGRKSGHYIDTVHYIGMELRKRATR